MIMIVSTYNHDFFGVYTDRTRVCNFWKRFSNPSNQSSYCFYSFI